MAKELYYPPFTKRLIKPESGDGNGRAPALVQWPPRTMIFHSAVGSGSLYNYFNNPNQNLESHAWIAKDGTGETYLQADRKADANLDANAFAYSVETADNGNPDKDPWSDAQCNTIADMMVWGHKTWGIPLKRCPAWDKPGMGYHTMWGAPSHWTPVAKTCPGKARIAQFDSILAEANHRANNVAPVEDDDMKATDQVKLDGSAKKFLEDRGAVVGSDGSMDYQWFVQWQYVETVQNNELMNNMHIVLKQLNENQNKMLTLLEGVVGGTEGNEAVKTQGWVSSE